MKKIIIGILVVFVSSCSSTKRDDYTTYTSNKIDLTKSIIQIELPQNQPVDVRGVYDSNDTIGQNNVIYQGAAGGAIGVFAQIMTHAAINSNMRDAKLSKQQIEANKVLAPLEPLLKSLNQEELKHANEHYQFIIAEKNPLALNLKSHPIFFISQDKSTLSIKNVVTVTSTNKKRPVYQNVIEVLNNPIEDGDPIKSLKANEGELLLSILKTLYEESLELAIKDLRGIFDDNSKKQQSYKFYNGAQKRVERATKLNDECNKNVLRNLRGWVVAYHVKSKAPEPTNCQI